MPTAHLVHGFNVSDGGVGTTDKLRPYFEDRGYTVMEHDSEWKRGLFRDLLSVRFGNQGRAEQLCQHIQPEDLLVGHSNGCAIIALACQLLAEIAPKHHVRCIFFNPALDSNFPVSRVISNILVFHTKTDKTVWLSKFLTFHRWGNAGQVGYQGCVRSKVDNVSYESIGLPHMEHSGVFSNPQYIDAALEAIDQWFTDLDTNNRI